MQALTNADRGRLTFNLCPNTIATSDRSRAGSGFKICPRNKQANVVGAKLSTDEP